MQYAPMVLGLLGNLFGGQQQANQTNQATSAQNQLIQQDLMPLLNNMLQQYQQNYAPIQNAITPIETGALGNSNLPGLTGSIAGAGGSPAGQDKFTGIPLQGITNQNLGYFENPQNTLTGKLSGNVVNQLMNPNTNAQNMFGGAVSGLNPQNMLAGLNNQGGGIFNQLMNASSSMLNSGGGGGGGGGYSLQTQQTGPQALAYWQNQMTQGLDPNIIAQGQQQYQSAATAALNNVRNQLGSNMGNPMGMAQDITNQDLAGLSNYNANVAGQSQALKNAAAQNLFGVAQGMDSAKGQEAGIASQQGATASSNALAKQQMGMGGLESAFGMLSGLDSASQSRIMDQMQLAGGLDSQTMQRLSQALSSAQSSDAQTAGMREQGQNIASGQSNQYLQDLLASGNFGANLLSGAQNYVGQGQKNLLTAPVQGLEGLISQYGQAASQSAQNQQNNNPFSFLGSFLSNNPSLLGGSGAGAFSPDFLGQLGATGGIGLGVPPGLG